jgi:hypothetical protein
MYLKKWVMIALRVAQTVHPYPKTKKKGKGNLCGAFQWVLFQKNTLKHIFAMWSDGVFQCVFVILTMFVELYLVFIIILFLPFHYLECLNMYIAIGSCNFQGILYK